MNDEFVALRQDIVNIPAASDQWSREGRRQWPSYVFGDVHAWVMERIGLMCKRGDWRQKPSCVVGRVVLVGMGSLCPSGALRKKELGEGTGHIGMLGFCLSGRWVGV